MQSTWPEAEVIANQCGNDELFLCFYRELRNRHMFATTTVGQEKQEYAHEEYLNANCILSSPPNLFWSLFSRRIPKLLFLWLCSFPVGVVWGAPRNCAPHRLKLLVLCLWLRWHIGAGAGAVDAVSVVFFSLHVFCTCYLFVVYICP